MNKKNQVNSVAEELVASHTDQIDHILITLVHHIAFVPEVSKASSVKIILQRLSLSNTVAFPYFHLILQ